MKSSTFKIVVVTVALITLSISAYFGFQVGEFIFKDFKPKSIITNTTSL